MSGFAEFEPRAAIERQAREWLIRLDGDEPLNPAEAQALRDWMSRSQTHRHELKRLSEFWKGANVLTELAVPLPQLRKSKPHGPRLALAAASVACISVVFTWWYVHPAESAANGSYATAIGQQQTITLPDGSSIQLNTDSQVQVRFTDRIRGIRMLRGEALFSVRPNTNRPFEVSVAGNIVRAVGTAFAVHMDGDTVDVTVTKGVVEVADSAPAPMNSGDQQPKHPRSRHERVRLQAGEVTSFDANAAHLQVQRLDKPELQRRMAWHDGYLMFSGEPLSQVVEQINRYSPVTLQIGDPQLSTIAIGGRFRIGDLDAVLDVLHTNFGIQSHQIDERNIRLEPSRVR